MPDMESLLRRLPAFVLSMLAGLDGVALHRLEEIRFRRGFPVEICFGESRCLLGDALDAKQMDELLSALSGYALYGCEAQLAQGYLPLGGGHRAGVCGRMCRLQDGSWHLAEMTSVCIRLGRYIDGAGRGVYRLLLEDGGAKSVLLLGPPGCGKTTVLRDCAQYLAKEAGLHVAVADEREELFGLSGGDVGLDVLSGIDKAQAFSMLIRSMAPQVIVTDEIGRQEDVRALLEAVRCGVGVLASAHAHAAADLQRRPQLRMLLAERVFDRYVLLGKHGSVCGIWDEKGVRWRQEKEEAYGDKGNGADGDDSGERGRLSSL